MTDHINQLKTLVGPVWDVPLVPYIEPAERAAGEQLLEDTPEEEVTAAGWAPRRPSRALPALCAVALMGAVAIGYERGVRLTMPDPLRVKLLLTPAPDPAPPAVRAKPAPLKLRQAPVPTPPPPPAEPDFSPRALERVLAI